jgi:hypothetical protein
MDATAGTISVLMRKSRLMVLVSCIEHWDMLHEARHGLVGRLTNGRANRWGRCIANDGAMYERTFDDVGIVS